MEKDVAVLVIAKITLNVFLLMEHVSVLQGIKVWIAAKFVLLEVTVKNAHKNAIVKMEQAVLQKPVNVCAQLVGSGSIVIGPVTAKPTVCIAIKSALA